MQDSALAEKVQQRLAALNIPGSNNEADDPPKTAKGKPSGATKTADETSCEVQLITTGLISETTARRRERQAVMVRYHCNAGAPRAVPTQAITRQHQDQ